MESTNDKKCEKVQNRIVQKSADWKKMQKCEQSVENILKEKRAE